MKGSSGEYIVGDGNGVWKTRTLMKRPLEERWDKGALGSVGGVPWRVNDNGRGNEDPIGFNCSIVQLFFCLLLSSSVFILFVSSLVSLLSLFSSLLFLFSSLPLLFSSSSSSFLPLLFFLFFSSSLFFLSFLPLFSFSLFSFLSFFSTGH